VKHPGPLPGEIGMLLGAEFLLAAFGNVLGRAIDYTDARLADEFTREVSLRVMEYATRLDLACLEDPAFYDKLERARVQATDRIGMLNAMGRLLLQFITLVSLSIGVIVYSPWLFVLLLICVAPAFAGESHFAFRGYALAHGLTPLRRELDYLRVLASSEESAKEVKLFGIAGYLRGRYETLTDEVIRKNRNLSRRRLWWGSALAIIGSLGYYGSFAYLVWPTTSADRVPQQSPYSMMPWIRRLTNWSTVRLLTPRACTF